MKLRQLLPAPPTKTYPLLVGQYWLMGTSTADVNKGSVIRIDGRIDDKLIITKWTVKMVNKNCKRTHTHKQFVVPYEVVFPTESAIRVALLKGPDKYYSHSDRRVVSRPQWPDDEQRNIPLYIQWVQQSHSLKTTDYIPSIYTDGSYSSQTSIEAVFRPDRQQRHASASVIIKDTSMDWKQKDVHIIHIKNGDHIQATSAYTMEFLALAVAMKLQTIIPTANTASV